MNLLTFLTSFLLIAGLSVLTILVLYLWFLAILYFVSNRHNVLPAVAPLTRFVFVVPAHNEEIGITATVQSLLSVHYPFDLFDVVVIADNCTDSTAESARNAGAECLDRHDAALRGKGYALRYAFAELLPRGYDAYIVIDADSIVNPDFLSLLDSRLRRDEKVVQAYDGISNPDASFLTYLFQVGNLIENRLYWEPKDRIGLPIFLRGNGMCFSREILMKYPWNAFSITEDTEYGVMLVQSGIRIHFAAEIGVFAQQPEKLLQAFSQRVRWAAGNSTLTKGRAVKLIFAGIKQRSIALSDIGVSLITNSRPLMLVTNIVLLFASVALKSHGLANWASGVFFAQMLYLCLGIVLNGFSLQKMAHLLLSPLYFAWLCIVTLLGAAGFRKTQWVRATRP